MRRILGSLCLWILSSGAFASQLKPLKLLDSRYGPYGVAMSRGTAAAALAFPTLPEGAKVLKAYATFFSWFDQNQSKDTITVDASESGLGMLTATKVDTDQISGWDHVLYMTEITDKVDALKAKGLKYATIMQKFDSGAGVFVIYEDPKLPWRDLQIFYGDDILENNTEKSDIKVTSAGDTTAQVSILFPYKTTVSGSMLVNGSVVVPTGNIFPDQPVNNPMLTFEFPLANGENTVQIAPQGFLTLSFVVVSMQAPVF